MVANTTSVSHDAVLDAAGVTTATLSLLGSLFVIGCYVMLPKLRKFAFKLVLWLAVSDMMFAVANLMGDPKHGSALCYVQAYIVSYFELAAVLWTTVIAHTLHQSLHNPQASLGVHKRMKTYHIYVWSASLLLTLLPQTTDSYGSAGSFCWIKGHEDSADETSSVDDLWRFVQFYGPLWVAMGYNTWVYYKARQMIQRMLRLKARGAAQKKRVPLLLYPAVLLVCWAFGTINRLQNWMSPDHPLEWLFAAQVVTSNLQGLLHALAYSQTASVRAQLKARLCGGRDGASHSGSSKLPGTGDESDSDGESGAHGASSGHVELLSMQSGPAGASPADAAAPVTRPRRASLIDVDMEQLSDVSHQIRSMYYASIGIYSLMGVDAAPQAFVPVADADVEGSVAKKPAGKATVAQTYFTLMKSFVGIGILALPHAFMQAGYMAATVGILVIGGVTYFCMALLIKSKQRVQERHGGTVTFGRIAHVAGGKWGSGMVDFCLVFSQVGFCTSYIIFIGDNVSDAVGASRTMWIILACALSLPLACLRNLKHLAFGALIADAAVLFGLITIFGFDIGALKAGAPPVYMVQPSSLALFFGVAVFAFEGIGVVIPVQDAMAEPERFLPVLRNCMVVYTGLICLTATVSYAAFGDNTDSMVTLNLPKTLLAKSVQVFYSVGLFFTFPIVLFPATNVLENMTCYKRLPKICGQERMTSIAVRTAEMVCVMLFALLIPHFGLFVNLVGAGACTALAFILPVWFHWVLFRDEAYTSLLPKVKIGAVVVFGVIGGGLSFVLTVVELGKLIGGGEPSGGEG